MRLAPLVVMASGTPAFAHHDMVVASSLMPTMLTLIPFLIGGLALFRRRLRALFPWARRSARTETTGS